MRVQKEWFALKGKKKYLFLNKNKTKLDLNYCTAIETNNNNKGAYNIFFCRGDCGTKY